ncbi:hypothetical protein FIBSPDRAFT_1042402 [Athelia psychrophila]|uniref:DUF6534 domain-containing protein n=1 Tax=Athelia psychrophila TaxID=1759441 RepID=A0A166ML78_9AGAM|nr:hypothetical protein FIBSPDRAFT_1042402 [Fibularhizoctonia sp. CBS 109695]
MGEIGLTFGALLIGALVACSLSGVVFLQSVMYFMIYPKDRMARKVTVGAIWALDQFHTLLIMISMWDYFVKHFGDAQIIDDIPWTLATTIAVTAVITFIVHCFLALRIHMLVKKNWWISGPIVVMAALRLVAAVSTTGAMIKLTSFTKYSDDFGWMFTIGLGLSSAVDCVITITLCYYLRSNRGGTTSLNRAIDSLVLYTFETGALTSVAAISSMMCWLLMRHNRIFLALHFVISKLYANSLLATLNMRITLNRGSNHIHFDTSLVVSAIDTSLPSPLRSSEPSDRTHGFYAGSVNGMTKLEINVERNTESQVNDDSKVASIAA